MKRKVRCLLPDHSLPRALMCIAAVIAACTLLHACELLNPPKTVVPPTFSPAGGTYPGAQSVTISCVTSGAAVRYTTSGIAPSRTNGTIYTGPVTVSSNLTLKAFAYATGWEDSKVATAAYTISHLTVAAPYFSLTGGAYAGTQSLTIVCATSGARIRYTVDGSIPTSSTGTLYTAPLSLSADLTLKAIAYKTGWGDSLVTSAAYTISHPVVATPAFSPPEGFYGSTQTVSIACATSGASIHYTTDGSPPTSVDGMPYTGPFSISADLTLKAMAYKFGWGDSQAASAAYSVTPLYVGGGYGDGTKWVPAYWAGTTRTDLPGDGIHDGWVISIFVSGATVYASGNYRDGTKAVPCYWTGTTRTDLPGDGTHDSFVQGLYVYGGTVYTSGSYNNGTKGIPCYWAGPTRVDLAGDGTHDADAWAIVVSGSTVYTAGYYNNGLIDKPCYWVDTTRTDLEGTGVAGRISGLLLDGSDVYTVGWYNNGTKAIPCYWKNTTRTDLTGDGIHDAQATSFILSGGKTYTSGYYSDGTKLIPCYWTGAVRTDLAGDDVHDAYAQSIAVSGSRVIVQGDYGNGAKSIPCLWVGSTRIDLPDDGVHGAWGHSMFVP